MVRLDLSTLAASTLAPATLAANPIQPFEAVLAEAEQTDTPPPPPTATFDELGMLGRHAVTTTPSLMLNLPIDATPGGTAQGANWPVGPQSALEPLVAPAAFIGNAVDAFRGSEISAFDASRPPATAAIRMDVSVALEPAPAHSVVQRASMSAQNGQSTPRARTASGGEARRADAAEDRPAQPAVRIDVSGPGSALAVAFVGPIFNMEGRGRLRRLMTEVAADLGLHLAEFSLNGETIAAPRVGALGGFNGRIRG